MRRAWIALVVLTAYCSWAQTPESGRTANQTQALKAKNDEHGGNSAQVGPKSMPSMVDSEKPIAPKEVAGPKECDDIADSFSCDNLKTQERATESSEKQASSAFAATWIVGTEVAISAAALFFLYLTFNETKEATQALRQQVELAKSDQRPWISVRLIVEGDFHWESSTHVVLPMRAFIKNIGKSPARYLVECQPNGLVTDGRGSANAFHQPKASITGRFSNESSIIFPGVEIDVPAKMRIDRRQLGNYWNAVRRMRNAAEIGPVIYPNIIICVGYTLPSSKEMRWTCCSWIVKVLNANGTPEIIVFENMHNITAKRITKDQIALTNDRENPSEAT